MKNIYLILCIFIVLTSCTDNAGEEGSAYYVYANEDTCFDIDNILYYPNSQWLKFNPFKKEVVEFYKLDARRLRYIKSCVKKEFRRKYWFLSKRKYFYQYIGFKCNSKSYVYVNFFSYIKGVSHENCLCVIVPDIHSTIITESGWNYSSGHILLDCNSGKIIEFYFNK